MTKIAGKLTKKAFSLTILLTLASGCVPGASTPLPFAQDASGLSTPTAIPAHPLPTRPVYEPGTLVDYKAQTGDTLISLAKHFNSTIPEILEANPLIQKEITTLQAGLELKIPIYYEALWGSQFQIIPDSLFINGPSQIGFDTPAFVDSFPGWLRNYSATAGGIVRRGGNLVDYVAQSFSISPRLLLALAEYQAGALSNPVFDPETNDYPLGFEEPLHKGLYMQLVWAANTLNNGYYPWRNGDFGMITRTDGTLEVPDPWQNAATVAFQYYFSQNLPIDEYQRAIFQDGIYKTYFTLFGDPWQNVQPHIPGNLQQVDLALPFSDGKTWAFTGGPHAGWGTGEPFAALDFAPPGATSGCSISSEFVTAVAAGQIVRTEPAIAILDLDQDGDERTGWVILYLHLGPNDTTRPGVILKTGDPIGHPSCEGGTATGTHIHIARKYNGEWVDADSTIPFNLAGWIAQNGSEVYLGTLKRFGKTIVANSSSAPNSLITAGN
ncbi:MAG: LysM peptidoglycan-binding domain-containing protein [Chloroflexi bacterium]|nr:LysM peptidoglycan-binding domain-containing protein [Chloroflexota bacterium]